MAKDRHGAFRTADCFQFFFGLDSFHFHQLVLLFDFFTGFIFFKVQKQKHQIGDAEYKSQEFSDNLKPGIKQGSVNTGYIVKNVVNKWHKAQNCQRLGILLKKLGCDV